MAVHIFATTPSEATTARALSPTNWIVIEKPASRSRRSYSESAKVHHTKISNAVIERCFFLDCSHNITVDPERREVIGPWHLTNFTKKLNCDWAISFPLDYKIELRFTEDNADDRLPEAHCPYEPKVRDHTERRLILQLIL